MESQELNDKMRHLYLDDDERFDAFFDQEAGDEMPNLYYDHDELFLDSGDDDGDGFLESDEYDEFLGTDIESEGEDGRMEGVDVVEYPWPSHMRGEGNEWLDEVSHRRGIEGHDWPYQFGHGIERNMASSTPGLFMPGNPLDNVPPDDFLESDIDDDESRHVAAMTVRPLSYPSHPIPSTLQHSEYEDDYGDDDDFLDGIDDVENPVPSSHLFSPDISTIHQSAPAIQFILPRSPQLSLGQAGDIICDRNHHSDAGDGYEQEFLESDSEAVSEMGIYTVDQYIPAPEQELLELEMGTYTVDHEYLDYPFELGSEIGDYTADHDNRIDTEIEHVEYTADQEMNHCQCEGASEMGVYTADQYFEPSESSSSLDSIGLTSRQNTSRDDDDEEEVVYRIPAMPVDMRNYQYPLEDDDDDFLMSDGGDAMSIHSDLPITPNDEPNRQLMQSHDHLGSGGINHMEPHFTQGLSEFEGVHPLFPDEDGLPFCDTEDEDQAAAMPM